VPALVRFPSILAGGAALSRKAQYCRMKSSDKGVPWM
jgi:hypothetical protein